MNPVALHSALPRAALTDLTAERFRFACRAIDPIRFHWFPGNVLRGGLGQALRRLVCVTGLPSCRDCSWNERCAYTELFETRARGRDARRAEIPHPFVLEPPVGPVDVRRGGPFLFDLVLIGRGCEALPSFVAAVEKLGDLGLGRPPARFALEEVQAQRDESRIIVYRRADGFRSALPCPRRLRDLGANRDRPVSLIDVEFSTPVAILDRGRVTWQLPFHLILAAVRRRLGVLAWSYGSSGEEGDELDHASPASWAEAARSVAIEQAALERIQIPRIQRGTGRRMYIEGMRGRVRYRGDLDSFMPYLYSAELVHVGNWTSFGFGKMEITVLNQRDSRGEKETLPVNAAEPLGFRAKIGESQ